MLMRRLTPTCTYIPVSSLFPRVQWLRGTNNAYHPLSALISLLRLDLNLKAVCAVVVLGLDGGRDLGQLANGIGPDELFVVQVVKQDVQALLRILDLRRKRCRRLGGHTLHVAVEHVHQRLRSRRDVRPVTRRVLGFWRCRSTRGWRRRGACSTWRGSSVCSRGRSDRQRTGLWRPRVVRRGRVTRLVARRTR